VARRFDSRLQNIREAAVGKLFTLIALAGVAAVHEGIGAVIWK